MIKKIYKVTFEGEKGNVPSIGNFLVLMNKALKDSYFYRSDIKVETFKEEVMNQKVCKRRK